jgi:hypothetical protein
VNRVPTKVLKARQVEVSFRIDERDRTELMNLDRLRKEGAHDFGGTLRDIQLTDYLTVHNVIAIEDIQFEATKQQQGYLDGTSNPRSGVVTVKLIIDNAKMMAMPVEEKLIGEDVLELPNGAIKQIE